MRRADALLVIVALAAGALFVASLGRIWPLPGVDLFRDADDLTGLAAPTLARHGIDLAGMHAERRLRIEATAVDHVQRAFGRERAAELQREGLPLWREQLTAKRADDPDVVTVHFAAGGALSGWERTVQEDAAAPRLDASVAESLARAALADLGMGDAAEIQRSMVERPARRDHGFTYERWRSRDPELRERVEIAIAGDRVAKAVRSVVTPAAALRAERADRGIREALQMAGIAGLTALGVAAAFVAVRRLHGGLRFGAAGAATAGVFALLLVAIALQQAVLHERWDSLTTRWIAIPSDALLWGLENLVTVLPVLLFLLAGDALDRERAPERQRMRTLWSLVRLRWSDPAVGAASARGFMIGGICGGTLAASVLLLEACGATVSLQPRGFFFHSLNSAIPILTLLCFFGHTVLIEEGGYRLFAGAWLERATRRRWLAALLPAIVYGLAHAQLDFLPPMDPPWARPLALTAVGCVWGWAFLRYDAATVVLSHLACDLFIFAWPQLASGRPALVAAALAAIAAPLAPALVATFARLRGGPRLGVPDQVA